MKSCRMSVKKSKNRKTTEETLIIIFFLAFLFWVATRLVVHFGSMVQQASEDEAKIRNESYDRSMRMINGDENLRDEERKKMEIYTSPEWQNKHDDSRAKPVD